MPFFLISRLPLLSFFFFFNDTATTEIYTLSLHDALPIFLVVDAAQPVAPQRAPQAELGEQAQHGKAARSEEHTSELQSPDHLVCRLLLEKKKNKHQCQVQHEHHRLGVLTLQDTPKHVSSI